MLDRAGLEWQVEDLEADLEVSSETLRGSEAPLQVQMCATQARRAGACASLQLTLTAATGVPSDPFITKGSR